MIYALANSLKVNLVILREDGKKNLITIDENYSSLVLGYQVGSHYQSLHFDVSLGVALDWQKLLEDDSRNEQQVAKMRQMK